VNADALRRFAARGAVHCRAFLPQIAGNRSRLVYAPGTIVRLSCGRLAVLRPAERWHARGLFALIPSLPAAMNELRLGRSRWHRGG
jgi:hypothetical protein